ncbi:MAG TPA: winged helix-turn-helix domain-containing protein [Candidatus Elarobacter sp.]|nr:winged helix-turn-helix domain-containing protein [Candidatus Elarobacter sp.]
MGRIVEASVAEAPPRSLQEVVKRYAFGPFVLDAQHVVLALGDGVPLPLGPRVVATLAALVERPGALVTKDELLDRVWGSADVVESNVAQSVYTLRKVLRAQGLDGAIATVPRRGYRFTAPVVLLPEPASPVRTVAARRRPPALWRLAAGAAAAAVLLAAGAVPARPSAPPPLSARGTELYRLARYHWNLRTRGDLARSALLFAAVVKTDPRNPLGYAGEADADLMTADYDKHHVHASDLYVRAAREACAALALDPQSAAAHTSLAMLRAAADHDVAGADAEFQRAIALDPSYAIAHHWYGILLFQRGRVAAASRELHRAIELDPVSTATSAWLAEASYYDHHYADAITYARRALDLDPRRGGAMERLGLAYELDGDLPQAIATFKRMQRGPEADAAPALLAEAYARAGRRAQASAALREAVRVRPRDDDTAFALMAAGQRARGLAILAHMPRSGEDTPVPDPRLERFRTV